MPITKSRSKPDWLTGIHAFFRESGTHHVITYNVDSVVFGIFDASFDEVKFSPNLWVNIQRYGHFGYGMDVSGLEYILPERMDISLIQILTQVMADANAAQIIPIPATEATDSAPDTLIATLPFPFAPIGKNGNQPKLTGTTAETKYAMRFSRRTDFHYPWPTREECELAEARSRKAKERSNNVIAALAPAPAPAPAAVSHTTQLSPTLSIYPPSSSSGSPKRQRDEEAILPSFPQQIAPVLHLRRRPRATRSIRAMRTRNAAAGPATDLHGASAMVETQSDEELSRPTKRPRTVAPVTAPIPEAPAAVAHRSSVRRYESIRSFSFPFTQPDTLQEQKWGTGKVDF
ncbi:hypothetical protein FRB94_000923 [Tulasnella sp. JGI-2019a]|nr:hypothetical protein FRB93_010428 [Tulasnella sp. JGI-2019a]KAG8988319.1 hypothetical protein FRB94_000923 [Tulasnella sp. JGI-2019a]